MSAFRWHLAIAIMRLAEWITPDRRNRTVLAAWQDAARIVSQREPGPKVTWRITRKDQP